MKPVLLLLIVAFVIAALFLEKNPAGGVRISRRITLLQEFWIFVRERKIWWMTPIMLILAFLGIFIVMTEKSVVIPLIYGMF